MNKGYSICLNEWALDNEIKNELRLLLIISSLSAKDGCCYASNEYLASLFNTTEETISRKIKKLEDKKYITISYEKRGCEVKKRFLRLTKISTDDCQKYQSTIDENVKDNNISINNISINNSSSSNIYDFLQKNGFIINPIHYETISQWEDNDLTRYAVKIAVDNGVYKISYIDAVLYNFKTEGIKTVEQAKAKHIEFKKQREIRKKQRTSKKMSFNEKLDMYFDEIEVEEKVGKR